MGSFLRIRLQGNDRDRKDRWIEAITHHWRDPATQAATWHRLSPTARQASHRLAMTTSLPAHLFLAEFGGLRRLRLRRPPFSPAEELALAGLLYGLDHFDAGRATRVTLPPDLAAVIRRMVTPGASIEPPPATVMPHEPPPLVHDIAQLLILRCLHPTSRLQHGRWLGRSDLENLVRRLQAPMNVTGHTTHKQSRYLRDLMFWAVAARLLEDGRLTAKGWFWLELTPDAALLELWAAWISSDQASIVLRAQFEQPDAGWDAFFRGQLVTRLQQMEGEVSGMRLANAILEDQEIPPAYFAANFLTLSDVDRAIAACLETTLLDLGVVQPLAQPQTYALTATGRRLCSPEETPLPAWQWNSTAALREAAGAPESTIEQITIDMSRDCAPYPQSLIALFAGDAPAAPTIHSYTLTRGTVARAASCHHGLALLLDGLARLDLSLSREQIEAIWAWWLAGRAITMRLLPVIQTQRAEDLAGLVRSATARRVIGEILGPTLATWEGEAAHVVETLRAAGYHPVVRIEEESAEHNPDRGALWLAGQLYLLLGDHLPLPRPLAATELAVLLRDLPPTQQALLEEQLTTLRQRLQELLDGLPYLPPPHPTDPARWTARIDEAIRTEAVITLHYHSAARNMETRRRVRPLWEEIHRGVAYVRAECVDTGAVLTFRLDRVIDIK
ncbi:MAG: WYL domain-containing protein [Caldilineaceae bacterium]|nr:WYL domain-containing protein [Caldilineaceae bacterium]